MKKFALLALLSICGSASAEVVGRYRTDFTPETPKAGWHYLWNAKGEVGAAGNYEPLTWSTESKAYTPGGVKMPSPSPVGFLSLKSLGGHAGRGVKQKDVKADAWAIAAYTIPAGKSGVAWISDGRILRQRGTTASETIQLRVYLGDQLKHEATVGNGEEGSFSVNLGDVKGGDVAYVAVGPDGIDISDGFEMDFRVAVLKSGEQPTASGVALKDDPTKPAPRRDPKTGDPEPRFFKSHEELLAKVKAQPDRQLVFLGDSITATWHKAPDVFFKTLGSHKPINLGVGGDTTQSLLYRIANGAIDGLNPRTVVINIGTNNAGKNSPEEIAAGVDAVVKAVRAKLPQAKIIVTKIFPRSEKPTDTMRVKVMGANDLIAKLDNGNDVRVIDINAQLLQTDGTISKELMPDFLHPNEPAYKAWAEAILPLLK